MKGCERPEDLLGDAGLMKELEIEFMERMPGAGRTAHLGYEDGKDAPAGQANRRNGTSSKRLKGQDGEVPIAVPRDRDGSFAPPIRQGLLGMLRDEGVSLCAKCSGQHPARPVAGDLDQRIVNRFRLTQGDDVCIVGHRRIVPSGSSGRLDHPPGYAAFSNPVTQFSA